MAEKTVLCDVTGEVATVTLHRPDTLNAQTPQTWVELAEIGRSLTGEVRVVVLRGAGTSFSAGLDRALLAGFFTDPGDAPPSPLRELAMLPPAACEERIRAFQDGFRWLRRPDLLSIAAVHGYALGAGFQLALACDLRILADNAQLALPEVTLGLVPDLCGTAPLVDLLGYSRALEIAATGRKIPADEALRLGLAASVVPLDDLDAAVEKLVAALTTPLRAALTEAKALLAHAARRSPDEQEAAERAAQTRRIRDLAGLVD
jgi:enoyl-CoA hydratase/carnithine racemase